MKSVLIGKAKREKKKYPYLGIFPDGEVVLFSGPDAGYSVHDPKGFRPHFSDDWDESKAVPLRGSVTLSNDN